MNGEQDDPVGRAWGSDDITQAFAANAGAFSMLASAMNGETLSLAGMVLAATGSSLSFFNNGVATAGLSDPENVVKAAIAFFDDRHLPFVLSLHGDDLDSHRAAEESGLELDGENPLMLLDADDFRTSHAPPDGFEIRRIDSEMFSDHIATDFWPDAPESFRTLLRSLVGAAGVQMFSGSIDGHCVSNGMSITRDGIVGVYSIETTAAARRKGAGEAITAAVIRAGFKRGGETSFLFASKMGYGVYERMGFTAVSSHRYYKNLALTRE